MEYSIAMINKSRIFHIKSLIMELSINNES